MNPTETEGRNLPRSYFAFASRSSSHDFMAETPLDSLKRLPYIWIVVLILECQGQRCTEPVPALVSFNNEICNNGRIAYLAGGNTESLYVYYGTGTPQLIGPAHHGDLIAMNSRGDIIFDDGFVDFAYEAIDLTTLQTPEPTSILLLGTGIAAIGLTLLRRRMPHPGA